MRCKVSLKGHKPFDLQDCKKKKNPFFSQAATWKKMIFFKNPNTKSLKNTVPNVPSYNILKYFELLF